MGKAINTTPIPEFVIKPRKGLVPINFTELWQFRELLYFLTWRDIKVKYKQSLLGIGWVVLRPIISMVIFSVLFGRLANIPSEGVPYPIFVFLGLLPWTYFASSMAMATESLVGSSNMITKIYFPRIMAPTSACLSELLDLMVSLSMLLVMMFYFDIMPSASILIAPALILAIFISALGPGILLSALNVKYHDVRYIIPFLVQIWMFVTPVLYPVSFLPEKYRVIMYLNPLSGPIEAFRAAVLGHRDINTEGLLISLCVSLATLLVGILYFRKVERTFADVI